MSDFKQAVKWLKERKKVRRLTFAKNRFLFQAVGGVLKIDGMGNYPIKIHDIEATDWEIYCNNHEWICYDDGEDCQYVSCSKEHKKICENCGIEKPKEIKFEKRSFSERIAYLKAKFDIGELTEEMYKIQIVAGVEDLK